MSVSPTAESTASAIRRVVISNVFPDDNRGGAAITMATIAAVRSAFPTAKVRLVSTRPTSDGLADSLRHTLARFPDAGILPAPFVVPPGRLGTLRAIVRSVARLIAPRMRGRPAALEAIAGADLVVSKGGHVFIERGGVRGVLGLWLTAYPVIYAHRLRIRTVVFASTVGPFSTRSSRWANKLILSRVDSILVRDPRSRISAAELGLRQQAVTEVPDSVFSMDAPSVEETDDIVRRYGLSGRRYGCFTVRTKGTPGERARLMQTLGETARVMLEEGFVDVILLVVQVHGAGSSDLAESATFAEVVADDRLRVISDDLSPRELIALYGAGMFVVGCRMHSTIFSVVAGTPAVVVALSGEKARGVFEQLRLEEWAIDQSELTGAWLHGRLKAFVVEQDMLRRRTGLASQAARTRAELFSQLLRRAASADTPGKARTTVSGAA